MEKADEVDPQHMHELMQIASSAGLVKGAPKPGQIVVPPNARQGRNDPCPCGSGKKYKRCCMPRGRQTRKASRRPAERPVISGAHIEEVSQSTSAPAPQQATAAAMLRAGVEERIVWAYLETGHFITSANKAAQPDDVLKEWEEALESYDNATPEERQILAVKDG